MTQIFRSQNWFKCVTVATILVGAGYANALTLGSLSDADSSFGAGTLTRDAISGFEWLDLDLSKTFSVNGIVSEFGPGGQFAGFSIATAAQVGILLTSSGILTTPNGAPAQGAFDTFRDLIVGPFGSIDDFGGFGCILVINGVVTGPDLAGVGIDRTPVDPSGCGGIVPDSEFITTGPVAVGLPIDPDLAVNAQIVAPDITISGIFLVRSTAVDAPSTTWILPLGLALLALGRRGRKAVSS